MTQIHCQRTSAAGKALVAANNAEDQRALLELGSAAIANAVDFAAAGHHAIHQHGGSDEIATATPSANAIPKAGAGGTLAIGWMPLGSSSSTVCAGNDSRLSDTRTPADNSVTTAKIADDQVTFAKFQNVASQRLLGRQASSSGDAAEISIAAGAGIALDWSTTNTLTIAATGGGGGSGSVESVGLSLPDIFAVSGSPVTSSGTLTAELADQGANRVLIGPASGSDDTPYFRTLVAADIPETLRGNHVFRQSAGYEQILYFDARREWPTPTGMISHWFWTASTNSTDPERTTCDEGYVFGGFFVESTNVTTDAQAAKLTIAFSEIVLGTSSAKVGSNVILTDADVGTMAFEAASDYTPTSGLGSAAFASTSDFVAASAVTSIGIDLLTATTQAGARSAIGAGTGSGTVTSVSITPPAAGITASGAVTSSGSITLALTNDLAALEGLASTGYAKRTGTDAWSLGTITAAAETVLDDSTTGAMLKTLGRPRKNAVANGEMRGVGRGTTFVAGTGSAANGLYLDNWYYVQDGAMAVTIAQSSDAPSYAQAGRVIPSSMRFTYTTGDSSLASSDYAAVVQRIPGAVWSRHHRRASTLSFWVRSSVAGNYAVTITSNVASYCCVMTYSISSANTWEFKTVSIPAQDGSGTWDMTSSFGYMPIPDTNTNSGGVILNFCVGAGTAYQTGTLNSWQNATLFQTNSSPANGFASNNNIFAITQVQIELGDGYSGYEETPYQEELLRSIYTPDMGGIIRTMGNPRPSAIINGDMQVWQRGTSQTGIGSTQGFLADRWQWVPSNDGQFRIDRDTTVPAVSQCGRVFNYSMWLRCTSTDSNGIGSSQYLGIRQGIEGHVWRHYAQQDLTISFWVQSNMSGSVFAVVLQNPASTGTVLLPFTINAADTWEFKILNFSGMQIPPSGNWNYDANVGAYLYFMLCVGSSFHTSSPGMWDGSHNYLGTASQANFLSSTSNYVRITGVKLEQGTGYSGHTYRSFDEELRLCQRYYWKSFPYATAPATQAGMGGAIKFIAGRANNDNERSPSIRHPVHMRATPGTITFYNVANNNAQARDMTSGGDCSSTTAQDANAADFWINAVGVNASTQVGYLIAVHAAIDAEF